MLYNRPCGEACSSSTGDGQALFCPPNLGAMQITSRVHAIPAAATIYTGPYPPNVYLVVDNGQAAMVDAGFGEEDSIQERLAYLAGLPDVSVAYIVLTHHHFDHSGGAHRLREATGASVVMHKDEAPLLEAAAREETPSDMDVPEEMRPVRERLRRWRAEAALGQPDILVDDNDRLRVGSASLRMVHTPGHSAGHICVFLEEDRVLFSGDNVLGMGTTAIAPPPHGDMVQYLASLRKMQALEAALLCPGHGPIVKEPNRKIQELLDHRRERDEQILGFIGQGRDTVWRLVKGVYPELDQRLVPMATGQVLSHLHKLEQEGKITMRREGDEVFCSLAGGA
jgi:glyoxylase-like metal-dependent hydrolase (beta-lactamase superfamily II)